MEVLVGEQLRDTAKQYSDSMDVPTTLFLLGVEWTVVAQSSIIAYYCPLI